MQDAYENFAKELKRRFEETYRDSKPHLKATMTSLGGENVEISILAIDRSLAEVPFLVSFTVSNAVDVAWDMMQGCADKALAKSHDG